MTDDTQLKRRAPGADVLNGIAAIAALRPEVAGISDFQRRASFLLGLALGGRGDPAELAAKAEMLLTDIRAAQARVDAKAAEVPEAIAGHARFQNVVRALQSAAASAEAARAAALRG